jgi:hypothetical protein
MTPSIQLIKQNLVSLYQTAMQERMQEMQERMQALLQHSEKAMLAFVQKIP